MTLIIHNCIFAHTNSNTHTTKSRFMIDYNFNHEDNILYINYHNEIIFEDYLQLFKDLELVIQKENLPKLLLVLSDYSDARINIGYEILPEMFLHMKKHFDNFDNIIEAFIHVNPFETALSLIAKERTAHESTYKSDVFASRESGLAWLQKHQ